MSTYPGTLVNRSNFCGLFKLAWEKAVTKENSAAGFEACGIYPLDPEKIPNEAFVPGSVFVSTLMKNEDIMKSQPEPIIEMDLTSKTNAVEETISKKVTIQGGCNTPQYVELTDCASPSDKCGCPPDIALLALEMTLEPSQLTAYKYCYENKIQIAEEGYKLWERLKVKSGNHQSDDNEPIGITYIEVPDEQTNSNFCTNLTIQTESNSETENGLNVAPDPEDSADLEITPAIHFHADDEAQVLPEKVGVFTENIKENVQPPSNTPVKPKTIPSKNFYKERNRINFRNTSSPNDIDSDVLPYPKAAAKPNQAKRKKTENRYFVITSDEAFEAKVRQEELKKQKEEKKNFLQLKRKEKLKNKKK